MCEDKNRKRKEQNTQENEHVKVEDGKESKEEKDLDRKGKRKERMKLCEDRNRKGRENTRINKKNKKM